MPEEIKPEVISKTQKSLGKFIKKPPLTEKLLKKPPFRFLHDIVNAIIKETGFLTGLFTSSELNSENVKERDAKIAFLAKLIDAIKIVTKTDLAARPSKIVAGLEPTETNLLLQAIGAALEKKIDSSEYVKQLQTDGGIVKAKTKKSKSSEKDKKSVENKPQIKTKEKVKTPSETPKSTDRNKRATKQPTPTKPPTSEDAKKQSKEKPAKKKKVKEPEEDKKPQAEIIEAGNETETAEVPSLSAQQPPEEAKNETIVQETAEVPAPPVDNEPKKRIPSASRPKSARPRSGELKPPAPIQDPAKPALSSSTLRPPSVRPSSARPGAPRLRPDSGIPTKEVIPMGKINVIVENFDKDLDEEEETVVIQSSQPEDDNSNNAANHEDVLSEIEASPGGNKGHLVEQILEQINEGGDGDKVRARKVEIDWQKDSEGKGSVSKETANLRNLIQTLTKTANPLGKLLNYLHEDIDAMHGELAQWRNTKKQLFAEIAKQKKITHELNKPLVNQLENLNEEINKYESEIVSTRSNILRNETKIKELLAK